MISRNGVTERRKNLQAFLRTRLCRYYPLGKCTLGAECKFAHYMEEVRNVPDFRKTRMCEMHMRKSCTLSEAECTFAHSREYLKVITDVFKTSLCRHWVTTGTCRSDGQCRFAHGEHELRDRTQSGVTLPVSQVIFPCISEDSLDLRNLLFEDESTDHDFLSLTTNNVMQTNYAPRDSHQSSTDCDSLGELSIFKSLSDGQDVHEAARVILAQLLLLHNSQQGS
jgi:Zinc finger C-x8-C-x5-C-x3-H type (and similar)